MAIEYSRKDLLSDLTLLIVVGVIAFGFYGLVKRPLARIWTSHLNRELPLVSVGTPIDDSWSVQNLTGSETIPLSSLKGKVLFINFWATWCAPCRRELPDIEKLYQRYKDRGVVFLCVSREDPLTLQLFSQKHPIGIPLYSVRDFPASFHVNALPTNYIVSRSGKIAFGANIIRQWDSPQMTDLIDSLLADPSPALVPRASH